MCVSANARRGFPRDGREQLLDQAAARVDDHAADPPRADHALVSEVTQVGMLQLAGCPRRSLPSGGLTPRSGRLCTPRGLAPRPGLTPRGLAPRSLRASRLAPDAAPAPCSIRPRTRLRPRPLPRLILVVTHLSPQAYARPRNA